MSTPSFTNCESVMQWILGTERHVRRMASVAGLAANTSAAELEDGLQPGRLRWRNPMRGCFCVACSRLKLRREIIHYLSTRADRAATPRRKPYRSQYSTSSWSMQPLSAGCAAAGQARCTISARSSVGVIRTLIITYMTTTEIKPLL